MLPWLAAVLSLLVAGVRVEARDRAVVSAALVRAASATCYPDARERLAGLLFYDGSGSRTCRRRETTLAFTTPGARVVFVCVAPFRREAPDLQAAVLLHEAFHSLGMPDEPREFSPAALVAACY